ncbi:cytochrome P450 [Gymnopus androsaceus JB14]|uniref:Cytochrome P450 n=1 Tax=Gymnopus androsaceus JB14 TaxID=1447944 RepID=A0A6A4IAQ7_9AGAR|nr:cytochrome P450 [Gymnopus androsaceus JB14]
MEDEEDEDPFQHLIPNFDSYDSEIAILKNNDEALDRLIGTLKDALSSELQLRETRKHYPPGPPRRPFIGNALQMPSLVDWRKFMEWAAQFGEITYLEALGQPIVVLNSSRVCLDLLVKRSGNYSDRPHMLGARKLALDLIQNDGGENLQANIKLSVGALVMRAVYGYDVASSSDEFLSLGFQLMENLGRAFKPESFLVNFIPQLKHMPEWIPGSGFLQVVKKYKAQLEETTSKPFLWSKSNMTSNLSYHPNLCMNAISKTLTDAEEKRVALAAANALGGGLETNLSSLLMFFLAMILNPSIQQRAQEEIDRVIGHEKLPEVADTAALPYVRSIITETLRWCPALPFGIARAASADDIYEGQFIPKGSFMAAVNDIVFGFGRRMCPGMYFSQGALFAIVSTVLATCNILPALDSNGKEIMPQTLSTYNAVV